METAEKKEGEGQAGQRRRQRGQSCAVVKTAEGLHPPAALSMASKGSGG